MSKAQKSFKSRFRPCIDLHDGKVKQIVGGTLRDDTNTAASSPSLVTNFVSSSPAEDFAARYKADGLPGGHVIMLGAGNAEAALAAVSAYPGGLHVGGGIIPENAAGYLQAGASHVIVTSYFFENGKLSMDRLKAMSDAVGPSALVVDLSCCKVRGGDGVPAEYRVATNRWQTITDVPVNAATMSAIAPYCDEFLVHAADVEGLCKGIDVDLVALLGDWASSAGELARPITYAGGARSLEDLILVDRLSNGRVDLTVGSALDIFGGSTARYADFVAWNHSISAPPGQPTK